MIYLIYTLDLILLVLFVWLILSAGSFWRKVNKPYRYHSTRDEVVDLKLDVDYVKTKPL